MTLHLSDSEKAERLRVQHAESARRFRKRNPGYRNKYKDSAMRYLNNNRHKHYARTAVWRAIRDGKIIRPDRCEHCQIVGPVEGDHEDYTKRLEVTWLCKKCHTTMTNKRSAIIPI